jgi:MerR family mercuric resistance operon transcriptional regulator
LIPEPPRYESSGYRAYPPETIERVQFIQNAKDLGFTLEEVRELLELKATDEASCSQIQDVAEQKADQIRSRINKLQRMLEGLESLTNICPGDVPSSRCPFINLLAD